MIAALLVSSCSAPHHAAPPDLATSVADFAIAPLDWGTFSCPQSLAAYCANALCPADLATAQATPWCNGNYSGWAALTGTCAGLAYVESAAVDTGTYYFYDATSGALVAVIGFNANSNARQCMAGPTAIDLRACTDGTFLCPSMDGGV